MVSCVVCVGVGVHVGDKTIFLFNMEPQTPHKGVHFVYDHRSSNMFQWAVKSMVLLVKIIKRNVPHNLQVTKGYVGISNSAAE